MYRKLFLVFLLGMTFGHAGKCEAQTIVVRPQQTIIVQPQPYVPPGGSIVQRPMGSDYDNTTPWCDSRYAASGDPCMPRPRR